MRLSAIDLGLPGLFFLLCVLASSASAAPKASTLPSIRFNQLGFLPEAAKVAVIPNVESGEFWLLSAKSKSEVLRGPLSQPAAWPVAGESVKIADFSAFNKPGKYFIRVNGVQDSQIFEIGEGIYDTALRQVAQAFYFNRAGVAVEKRFSADYSRPAAHPDLISYIHPSAASSQRPQDFIVAAQKGWYDSGDYNKYVINTSLAVYQLLVAFEREQTWLAKLSLPIVETNNTGPDLLDEIHWGLDWLLAMQDPNDGGVYHKLTSLVAETSGMPHEQNNRRYLMQKSTAASLHFAATFSLASRVLQAFGQDVGALYQERADKAWRWAQAHPKVLYSQPAGIKSRAYAWTNENLQDEWLWAAAELYATTAKRQYLKGVKIPKVTRIPSWQHVEAWGLVALAGNPKTPIKLKEQALAEIKAVGDESVREYWRSGYLVPLAETDFVEGSNFIALNKAMLLLEVNRLAPRVEYVDAARGLLDYVLGRNPNGIAYVTGLSEHAVLRPRHALSRFDGVTPPIPGLVVSGPFAAPQDGCRYVKSPPAKQYLDEECSATNDVSLSGNASLLYLLAVLRELH